MKPYDVCEWSCVWTRGKYLVSLRFVSNYTVRKNSRKREHGLIQLPNERSGFNLRRRTGSKSEQEERQELTFFLPICHFHREKSLKRALNLAQNEAKASLIKSINQRIKRRPKRERKDTVAAAQRRNNKIFKSYERRLKSGWEEERPNITF